MANSSPPAATSAAWTAALVRRVAVAFVGERERWVLWLAAAMGSGVVCYFLLRFEPSPLLGPTWVAAATALGIALRRNTAALLAAMALVAAGLGFGVAQVRTAMVMAPILQQEVGPVAVTGRLLQVEQRPDDQRLTLSDLTIDRVAAEQTPERVRVTMRARGGEPLAPGQRVTLRAVLMPPPGPAAPGAFDFARDAFFDRIGGVGYAVSAAAVIEPAGTAPWTQGVAAVRHSLSERIRAVLPGQVGAIAAALTTGERAGIDEETWNALRDSGLAHILSISGLHFALVAGILFFTVRALLALIEPIALRFPIKKWAAVAALAGSLGYFLLAGASAPTERSFLMLAIAMVAILLDRRPFSMRMVTWAAIAVLIVAPDSLVGPSFQMSFAAVVALIAAYELLREPFARWGRGAGLVRRGMLYLAGVALSSLVAGFATAPYALYHFDRFSTYSLAANLAAVPLTGFWIMPWAVLSFALMPFGLEQLALVPMGWGIQWMVDVGAAVASWPGAAVVLPAMPPIGLALVTVGGLWLCLWQARWRIAGLPLLVFGLATVWLNPKPDLLISDDGAYTAVRAADGGMWVSSSRSNFTTDTWLRRDGREEGGRWPALGAATADGRLRCDRVGCIYRANGLTVALPKDEDALVEDCRTADVVVAQVAVLIRCAAPTVIDRIDLWRDGAAALWFDEGVVRVRTVADVRGVRPWTPIRPQR